MRQRLRGNGREKQVAEQEVAMQVTPKFVMSIIAVILVALGIMLFITLSKGDVTHEDKNNSDVESNSSQIVNRSY
jgi:cytoskeletal protein RodZ